MYKVKVPFKDFNGTPRNQEVCFNLTETEVFKLLREFQLVFNWRKSIDNVEMQDLDTGEVIEFYTAFEDILLAAYGKPSEDGLYFDKSDRYRYETSALHNAAMVMFVTEPEQTGKLLDGIMPEGLGKLVEKADANLVAMAAKEGNSDIMQRQIDQLRAELAVARGGDDTPAVAPSA